jgi:hypothetical protein
MVGSISVLTGGQSSDFSRSFDNFLGLRFPFLHQYLTLLNITALYRTLDEIGGLLISKGGKVGFKLEEYLFERLFRRFILPKWFCSVMYSTYFVCQSDIEPRLRVLHSWKLLQMHLNIKSLYPKADIFTDQLDSDTIVLILETPSA